MEPISLRYGDCTIPFQPTGARSVQLLLEKENPEIENLEEAFLKAVTTDCIDSPPLRELVSSQDEITIVISDITRFWMRQDRICSLLVRYLHDTLQVPYENIVILVALGTHRPQTESELQTLVTPEVYQKVRVVNHDCMADDLCYVGTTSLGTKLMINKLAVGRKVILIGGTVHHLMAGYGGGRKSILPGIAGKESICQNHIHSLSPHLPKSNPLIGTGLLLENPVSEDMNEAAALVNPVFGFNLVTNSRSNLCAICCGHYEKAWLESCRLIQEMMGLPIQYEADTVIVSCGGYPKDINLYQGVKSLLNAGHAVREGGTIIFLAQCPEGGGAPAYFSWIESLKRGTLDYDLRQNFSIDGYIFYASCEVIARCSCVYMLTDIPPETMAQMGVKAYADVEELMGKLDFSGQDVYIMPFGGSIVPFLEK